MTGARANGDSCDAVRLDLGELALGVLSGEGRSKAAAHVEGCAACRSELERLGPVVDALLELAPEAEPPFGFESRLSERLARGAAMTRPDPTSPTVGRRRRRRSLLSIAALVAVAFGFGIGLVVGAGHRNPAPPTAARPGPVSVPLESAGRRVGTATVTPGRPVWLYVEMTSKGSTSGVVACTVTLTGGRTETLGRFRLVDGRGSWGVALAAPGTTLRAARLVAADGSVVASARLRA